MFKRFLTKGDKDPQNKENSILSPEEFTETFISWLLEKENWPGKEEKKALPSVKKVYEVELMNKGGGGSIAYLDNAYSEYKRAPEDLNEILQRYSFTFLEAYKEYIGEKEPEESRTIVIPIIRPKEWFDSVEGLDLNRIFAEPLAHDLLITYVFHQAKGIGLANRDSVAKLGISESKISTVAVKNLSKAIEPIQIGGKGPVFYVIAGGNFESSLVLMKELWTRKNFPVEGDFVFGMPARDLLLVTGSKKEQGLAKLKEVTEKFFREGDHRISPEIFVWKEGKINVLGAQ